jgi:hypothetical protein
MPSALAVLRLRYLGCVRTHPWAFPCQYYSRYCYPYGYSRPYAPLYGYAAPAYVGVAPAPVCTASARWWPGYYDYAPGQFGRARHLGRGLFGAWLSCRVLGGLKEGRRKFQIECCHAGFPYLGCNSSHLDRSALYQFSTWQMSALGQKLPRRAELHSNRR